MGCLLSSTDLPESVRAHTIGDLLNLHLPPLLRPYIRATLQHHLDTLRGPDGFLLDSAGKELRFDPDNLPPPPRGPGIQLCFKSLPHHNQRANTPVTVDNTDQLALLYCREFVRTRGLTIGTADSSSLLNMLARASCFPSPVRVKAARVREEVRNLWAHGDHNIWTRDVFITSLSVLMELVVHIPNHQMVSKKINDLKRKS